MTHTVQTVTKNKNQNTTEMNRCQKKPKKLIAQNLEKCHLEQCRNKDELSER